MIGQELVTKCSGAYLIFVIFFTLTHFESWKFYTRKVRKFTTNGAQSSNFLIFFWNFLHSAKIFTLTAFTAFLTNMGYAMQGDYQSHHLSNLKCDLNKKVKNVSFTELKPIGKGDV